MRLEQTQQHALYGLFEYAGLGVARDGAYAEIGGHVDAVPAQRADRLARSDEHQVGRSV